MIIRSQSLKLSPRNVTVNENGETIITEGQMEYFYQIPYMIENYDDAFIESLNNPHNGCDFHYPDPNPFIPIKFNVIGKKFFGSKGEEQQILSQSKILNNQNRVTRSLTQREPKNQAQNVVFVNDSPSHLIQMGKPIVIMVQGGPGVNISKVCDFLVKRNNFVHLSVEGMINNENSAEIKRIVEKGGISKVPAAL